MSLIIYAGYFYLFIFQFHVPGTKVVETPLPNATCKRGEKKQNNHTQKKNNKKNEKYKKKKNIPHTTNNAYLENQRNDDGERDGRIHGNLTNTAYKYTMDMRLLCFIKRF